MSHRSTLFIISLGLSGLLGLSGCDSALRGEEEDPKANKSKSKPGNDDDSGDEDSSDEDSNDEDSSDEDSDDEESSSESDKDSTSKDSDSESGDNKDKDEDDDSSSPDKSSDDSTSSDSSSSDDSSDEKPDNGRDCEKISWGSGSLKAGAIIPRDDQKGLLDKDGDGALESNETEVGTCQLHLTGKKCGLIMYGFSG